MKKQKEDQLMKKRYEKGEELSDTHSLNFQWPFAIRSAHTSMLQWLICPSSLSLPP
jgi:hypothetical protein